MVIYADICVFLFSILVSDDPQQCSWVWFTSKHGITHNPMLHFWQMNYVLLSLWLAETAWHQILHKPVSVVSCVTPALPWNLNNMRQHMTCTVSSKFCITGSPLYSRSYLKRINLENEKLKSKQNKNGLQPSFIKIGRLCWDLHNG